MSELPNEANFCLKCGQALSASKQHLRPSLISEAERKTITALFSDLTGYTVMTERLDPEEVKEITSRVFDGIRDVVSKYEGFIERFAGDGVLVLFGVPRVHEDDPMRAIRAAWEIHQHVESLNPQYESKVGRILSMHSGINTGLAVTGDDDKAKGTYGVTGEAINVAARLSELAGAGEILVGANTHRASKNHFTFQKLQPREVRGKSESIRIYKLVSAKAPASAASRKRKVSSEMVGRDQEMARLESQVIKAINGEGSMVNVIGEAGIGLEGRAISIGKNLSFHPIIDLLKHWAEIIEDDSESEAFDKLENSIRAVHPEETNEILPFIATLMSMKLSGRHAERVKGIEGEALEKVILKNVRDLLIKATDLTPLVIVTEDLHWADTSSLDLLLSLFRLVKTRKIVFVNVFRSGHKETGDRIAEKSKEAFPENSIELVLQSLDETMSEALIHNMVKIGRHHHPVIDQIVQRAGGNPFFIEEVVRSFIDEGVLVIKDGAFEVTEKIDTIVVPHSLNDVLMARIDRLEERTRELIKVASVIGRNFFYRILAEVAKSIGDIDKRLDYLKEVQLIRERRRMEELEYLFKHALVQEVAYESILLQKRRQLHETIADSIEKVFKKRLHEFYGMLAFHYSMGENAEKAEQYLIKAGEEALRSSASSEALHYFQEALQRYLTKYGRDADPAKLAILEKNIALAFYSKGQWPEAVKYLDSVLERWRVTLPKRGLFGILRLIFDMLLLMKVAYWKLPNSKKTPEDRDIEIHELYYRAAEALVYVDNIREFQVAMADFRCIAKFDLTKIPKLWGFLAGLAAMFSFSGLSFKLSNRLLKVSARFEVHEDVVDRIRHSGFSSVIYNCQGAWEEIQDLDWDLVNTSLEFGELWPVSNYLWYRGLVKGEQGNFKYLMMIIDRLFEMADTYDYIYFTAIAHGLKGDYFIRRKSPREALSEAERSILYSRQLNFKIGEMAFMASKAEAQQLAGDTEGARDSVLQASEMYKMHPGMVAPPFVAPLMVARFLIAVKELKDAIDSGNSSAVVEIKKQTYKAGKTAVRNSRKYAPYRTKILGLMGEYYWFIGKQGKALKWWGKAIQEGEKLGARPDLSRTYFKVGKHLLEPHSKYRNLNGIDSNGYLEKSRLLFEELSLEQDLTELDKITLNRQA
jgi:class 3 adenylate cyclase/tetratricopeptide (TPR) repeat protein